MTGSQPHATIPPPTIKGRRNPRWMSHWYDEQGRRRSLSFGSANSTSYDDAIKRWSRAKPRPETKGDVLSLGELVDLYLGAVAANHVGKDLEYALKPLKERRGELPAAEFKEGQLDAWQTHLASEKPRSVSTIARRVKAIKRMMEWAKKRKLIPVETWDSVEEFEPLRRPIERAYHPPPRKAPPDEDIDLVMHDFQRRGRVIGDMIELQRWTGMRSGDLCRMSWDLIDTSHPTWLYTPDRHKMAGLGRERVIFLGPKCRAILERYRGKDPMFLTTYGNPFTPHAYAQTIEMACKRLGVGHWVPHQLRHWLASYVARHHGDRAAANMIGDTPAVARAVYIHGTGEVAEEVG